MTLPATLLDLTSRSNAAKVLKSKTAGNQSTSMQGRFIALEIGDSEKSKIFGIVY